MKIFNFGSQSIIDFHFIHHSVHLYTEPVAEGYVRENILKTTTKIEFLKEHIISNM